MGLALAFKNVYRVQGGNILRAAKWLFWAVVFFYSGWILGLYQHADDATDARIRFWSMFVYGGLAIIGFILQILEWRWKRPRPAATTQI